MSYDVGDVASLFLNVTDPTTGLPADATSVTLQVTLPDGTATNPSVSHPGTGSYTATLTTTQAGRHVALWTATGSNAGTFTEVFHADATTAADQPIVSLTEARTWLGLNNVVVARDELLRDLLDQASDVVERYTGRTYRRQTFTETYDGGACSVVLRHTPVQSVTTVTESGTTVASTGWVLDPAGILHRGTTVARMTWLRGQQNVTVTYVAGASTVPARIRQAVLEQMRWTYESQRGGSGLPRQQGADDGLSNGPGWLMPMRVKQLLDLDRAPGYLR